MQGVPRKLQYQSLFSYLTFQYVPHPDTMFEHIHKLGPAERLLVNSDGVMKIEKYWEPHFQYGRTIFSRLCRRNSVEIERVCKPSFTK